jgi:hypothetical protein
LHIADSEGKSVAVDSVEYAYEFQGRTVGVLRGEAMGTGTFQAVAALTDVGEWKVRVALFQGTQQVQVEFTLRVMANI